MDCAIGVEPTKPTALTRGSSMSASTAALSPWTTLRAPAGMPASRASSARRTGTEGSRSEGLRTNALPAARAMPAFHSGIIAGKLKGVMPTATPSGWRMECTSMPVPASAVNSPLSRCGAPAANSTTSMPRWMSPLASGKVLPCSWASTVASSSMFSLIRSTQRSRMRPRRCGFSADHAAKPSSAEARAASISSAEASGTRAATLPVAGW